MCETHSPVNILAGASSRMALMYLRRNPLLARWYCSNMQSVTPLFALGDPVYEQLPARRVGIER